VLLKILQQNRAHLHQQNRLATSACCAYFALDAVLTENPLQVYECVCVCALASVCVFIHVCMLVCVCICVFVSICIYVCVVCFCV
jgi:hypothetical protein